MTINDAINNNQITNYNDQELCALYIWSLGLRYWKIFGICILVIGISDLFGGYE